MTAQRAEPSLVPAAEAFKRRVRATVEQALAEFEQATGVTPSAVTIELVTVSTRHDAHRRYVLGEVTIGFEL